MSCRNCKYLTESRNNNGIILYCSENHDCTFNKCEYHKTNYPDLNKCGILINALVKLAIVDGSNLEKYTLNDLSKVKMYIENTEVDLNTLDKILKNIVINAKLEGIKNIVPKIKETIEQWENDLNETL